MRSNGIFFFSFLLLFFTQSGGPLAFATTVGSTTTYQLAGVVDTGTASTGGPISICGGAGSYGIYGSVSANNAWIVSAMSATNTSTTPLAITSGAGRDATLPSSGLAWYIIAAPVIGGVLLLIILIIVCCCCCGKNDERKHRANVRKVAPVRMVATGPARPVSPRPGGAAAPVYATVPGPAPVYTPSNRPPVRPEYAVPANVAYGHPTMDPAIAYAPPPPAAANYNYPPAAVAPGPGAPVVYTPAPVVYTPNNYGRM
jgi:hypothetical protein